MQHNLFETSDRRSERRRALALEGWLRTPDGAIAGVAVLDLSAGGAGLAVLAAEPVEVGDRVELAVDLGPGVEDAWIPGLVRWRRHDRLGVSFGALPTRVRRAIARTLEHAS